MQEFFLFKGDFYCLITSFNGVHNQYSSIIRVSKNSINRTNFIDLQDEVDKGGSEYIFTLPFVSKFNEIDMNGEKITKSEFYKNAYKVLNYENI